MPEHTEASVLNASAIPELYCPGQSAHNQSSGKNGLGTVLANHLAQSILSLGDQEICLVQGL